MKFDNIKKKILKAIVASSNNRTAKEFLKLSDRQLEDLGISRHLLLKGHKAFPWRKAEITQKVASNDASSTTITKIRTPSSILHSTQKVA